MDADVCGPSATIRTWEPGDRIRILGSGGTRKIQDLFTEARIPVPERHRRPLVCCRNRIVWVPGVALHDAAKITTHTIRAYRFTLSPSSGG